MTLQTVHHVMLTSLAIIILRTVIGLYDEFSRFIFTKKEADIIDRCHRSLIDFQYPFPIKCSSNNNIGYYY